MATTGRLPHASGLPYGLWDCGEIEILFDRNYCPIHRRRIGQPAVRENYGVWVAWERQDYFYDDGFPRNQDLRKFLKRVLADFLAGRDVRKHLKEERSMTKLCLTAEPPLRLEIDREL